MMRRYAYNIYKVWMLTTVLLLASGCWNLVMGQEEEKKEYVIKYKNTTDTEKGSPQENIPTLEETVYIKEGETRTLEVGNYEYYWYFRWYSESNGVINIDNLNPLANSYLQKVESFAPSYFWYIGMKNQFFGDKKNKVGQIEYTSDDGSGDVVYCDLSFYVDDMDIEPEKIFLDSNYTPNKEFTEPTISKRYKFNIRSASEIIELLKNVASTSEALETFYITVPEGAEGVNLQMDMTPENYYWENYQGSEFKYAINGGNDYLSSINKLITISGPINDETTVDVYAADGDTFSPCLAKFVLTPQKNSGFKTDIENDEERNPSKYSDKYAQVGAVDFDYNDVISLDELKDDPGKNWMSNNPIDPSLTTYGFATPTLPWINEPNCMPEDTYGLYRSANVKGVSDADFSRPDTWGAEYMSNKLFEKSVKTYGWYYTKNCPNSVLYDRTYYNTTNHDKCGYFYYVNASQEAGRVVTVPIDGTICANTELTITAWVADITDGDKTVPNVSLMLRGVNEEKGTTAILHRFSSGDMLRTNEMDRAIWKQLCYKVTISQQMLEDYDDFYVDFYNNAPNSDGADYAIDDIRIYKSLPAISVQRENACEASSLLVSSDYETILRNMDGI